MFVSISKMTMPTVVHVAPSVLEGSVVLRADVLVLRVFQTVAENVLIRFPHASTAGPAEITAPQELSALVERASRLVPQGKMYVVVLVSISKKMTPTAVLVELLVLRAKLA